MTESPGTPFLLSLGSNMGDRRAHLAGGLALLSEHVDLEAVSRVVESDPWGPGPPQGPYLNLVARGKTRGAAFGAFDLLDVVRAAEARQGRERAVRYGPRTLDVDIVFFGDLVVEDDALGIPHPHWRERPFVLGLLGDVAGDMVEPRSGVPLREIAPSGTLPEGLVEVEPLEGF